MVERATKKGVLWFDEIVKQARSNGARLTDPQRELLAEAAWLGARREKDHPVRAMVVRERNLKKTIVDNAASSFADVALFVSLVAGQRTPKPAWFGKKDIRRVVPVTAVAELVDDLCHAFGVEYSELVLEGLRLTYEGRGERLTILRQINYGSVRPNEVRAVFPGLKVSGGQED